MLLVHCVIYACLACIIRPGLAGPGTGTWTAAAPAHLKHLFLVLLGLMYPRCILLYLIFCLCFFYPSGVQFYFCLWFQCLQIFQTKSRAVLIYLQSPYFFFFHIHFWWIGWYICYKIHWVIGLMCTFIVQGNSSTISMRSLPGVISSKVKWEISLYNSSCW